MSDKKKIQQKQQAVGKEYFKNNILDDLLGAIDENGNLKENFYIPEKERDFRYLERVLSELGYTMEILGEEYNSYHECFCKKIKIAR